MTSLLQLRELTCTYGGLRALDQVSLDITAGTVHAVIGPNGAGKTSLLRLIAGTRPPAAGRIVLDGRDITAITEPGRARLGIGRTFQHPTLADRLSCVEHVAVAVHGAHPLQPARHRATLDQAHTTLAELGLHQHADIPAGALSYGRRRLLELIMALAGRPRLLLLDEPSAGLDPTDRHRLAGLLRRLATERTVVLVDHHLDLVFTTADRISVLHHGRHLATGSPEQVRADRTVQAAYLPATGQPRRRSHTADVDPVVAPAGLCVADLHAGYHDTAVLRGVNLTVAPGRIHAVVGRNGTGKTTLVHAIAGLHPHRSAGAVWLADRDLTGLPPYRINHAGLAVVPQGRRLFADLTVDEHLRVAAPRRSLSASLARARVLDELFPALATRLRHRARHLSGGEQQMLALARALLTGPTVLVLDEPSEGLAPTVVDALATALADLADAAGLAVLLTEQQLDLVTAVADRVDVLADGRLGQHFSGARLHNDPTPLHHLLAVPVPATPAVSPRQPRGSR